MNNHLYDLIHNAALLSAVSGWLVAQISKTILHTIVSKKFDAERLVGTGGMPSSHSATVCGLATGVFLSCGAGSVEFAVAAALAIIVMYDALGVRRQAGEQAKVLNEMIEVFEKMGKDITPDRHLDGSIDEQRYHSHDLIRLSFPYRYQILYFISSI